MAINLEEIERGYAEAMYKKYSAQLEAFSEVFENPGFDRGEMHISLGKDGSITLAPGVGKSDCHNISNQDARNILNLIRISIRERRDKFQNKRNHE
jgi:hypothetical protein